MKKQKQHTVVHAAEQKASDYTLSMKNILIIALLLIITFLVYAKAIQYGFIYNWDDAGYILKNEYIHTLNFSSIIKHFTTFQMHNYHPLTTLSYAIEYAIVGEEPWLYHLNNILLHCINTLLVFILFWRIFQRKFLPSFFVAALFALHPMHVESVAWISERKDVLYSFFFLLSLIVYVQYLETGKKRFLLQTFIFFVLSSLSKSAAVTLPVVLLVFDWYFRRSISWNIVIEKIPFFIVSIIFGVLAIHSQDTAIQNLKPMLNFFERVLIVCWAFCLYVFKLLFPVNLSAFYPYPLKFNNLLPWYYYISPFIVLLLASAVIFSLRYGRQIFFGFAFFLITISLVLQIIPVGGAIIAERYTYIPYLGLFFIMAYPLSVLDNKNLTKKIRQYVNILMIIYGVMLVWFTYLTNKRVQYWKNGDILFSDVLNKYPMFPYGYNNRGFLYFDYYALQVYKNNEPVKQQYIEKAMRDFSKAIELDPTYVGAYINRAVLLYNTGRAEQALEDFHKALALDPTNKDGLLGRANTLSTLQRFAEALPDYNKYIELYEADWKTYLWRGIAYSKIQQHHKALSDFERANQLNPNDYEPYLWLGITYYYLQNYEHALKLLSQSIDFQPSRYDTYVWRGLVYQQLKDFEKAIVDFTRAIELNPSELSSYYNRSLAYNALGKYQEAFRDLIYAAERGLPISKEYYLSLSQKIRQ